MLKKLLQFSVGSFAAAAVSFFTTPIVTYFIIPEYFGVATLFSTVAVFLFPIVNFGTDQAFMRFFYEKKGADRYALLWSCLFPCFCIFIFLCAGLLIFSHRVSLYFFDKDIPYLVVLLCVDLFFRLIQRYSILSIRMQQKALLFSLLNFFLSITNTATIIVYSLFFEKSYLAIIYGGIVSNLVVSVIAILIERKFWFSKFKITGVNIKEVLLYSVPLVAAHFLSTLFDGIDKYCLKQFSTFYELGLYSVSFKIIAALRLIQSGFSMYWTPAAFEHYEKHKDDTFLYETVFENLLFFLVIAALLLIMFKDIIVLILSRQYSASAHIMPFLVFLPVMYTITEVSNLGIYFKKKMMYETYTFIILDLIAVGLNFVFLSKFGAKGAAMVISIVYLCYFYVRTFFSIRLYPMKFKLVKATVYFFILWLVAFVNTFVDFKVFEILSASAALVMILIVDRRLLKMWIEKCLTYIHSG
ncbi:MULTISPECIES: lipopolysaccharide biosynthesis protein [unclassified Treponema]|uniref:lipopolysaccharide biosynthesis protein n=1 Tax=unclassified Treponema TaxID=2638727 RepID=UPI00053015A6|nr:MULTISPECIES: oligosaccharide flippase family protein [unclassified Treponema]AIW88913.1 hypothetical protein JO41_03120 [Treponema sp. OMZ 838]UTC51139.1 oligosaccharide flippase family protein [Treponema sp. OMZ 855]